MPAWTSGDGDETAGRAERASPAVADGDVDGDGGIPGRAVLPAGAADGDPATGGSGTAADDEAAPPRTTAAVGACGRDAARPARPPAGMPVICVTNASSDRWVRSSWSRTPSRAASARRSRATSSAGSGGGGTRTAGGAMPGRARPAGRDRTAVVAGRRTGGGGAGAAGCACRFMGVVFRSSGDVVVRDHRPAGSCDPEGAGRRGESASPAGVNHPGDGDVPASTPVGPASTRVPASTPGVPRYIRSMPFVPGQQVVAAVEGLGSLTGRVVREAADTGPGAIAPPAGAPRVYVVEWTLEDGSTISNTAAEGALRAAGPEAGRG